MNKSEEPSIRIRKKPASNIGLTALKWAVAAVAVYFVLRRISFHNIGPALMGANWWLLGLSILFQYGMVFLNALRWKILLRHPGVGLGKYLYFIFMGLFFNLFLPSPAVSEGVKVLAFGRKYGSLQQNIGVTLFARGIGVLTQLLIGLIALSKYYSELKAKGFYDHIALRTSWIVALGLALVAGAFVLFRFRATLIKQVWISTMVEAGRDGTLLIKTILLTVAIQIFAAVCVYLVFLSVLPHVDFWKVVFFVTLIQAILILPFSFGGVGVREYLVLFFFCNIGGMPPTAVFAANMLGYVPLLLQAMTGGAWMLFRRARLPKPDEK